MWSRAVLVSWTWQPAQAIAYGLVLYVVSPEVWQDRLRVGDGAVARAIDAGREGVVRDRGVDLSIAGFFRTPGRGRVGRRRVAIRSDRTTDKVTHVEDLLGVAGRGQRQRI